MSHKPSIVFYISGHGFGHASRDLEIINVLRARDPDLEIIVCTQVPAWLIETSGTPPVELRQVECDTGLQQLDSLHLDAAASLRRAADFYQSFDRNVVVERDFLRARHARLVLGDIPPLAFEAAAAAGLQSVAIGNFTWDWIYEDYPEHIAKYPDLLPTIRRAYARVSLALRLPMHGGFAGLERMTRDIPLVARRAHRSPEEIRRALGLPDRPLLLLSFGGYGVQGIDPAAPERLSRYGLVIADDPSGHALRSAFSTGFRGAPSSNLIWVSRDQLRQTDCRYPDLVRAVDVVVTKPGYGIVSECIANDTAMLYTSRGRFREYDELVAGMQRYTRCEFIDHEALLAGRWEPYVERLLARPAPSERPRVDGAEVAAQMILGL